MTDNFKDYLGVIILESLDDHSIMADLKIIRESPVHAPAGDPYPIWTRELVEIPRERIETVASMLASVMREDFYNHFVDSTRLVVVFKHRYFVLDKRDKSGWGEMIRFGKTVRVGPEWTESIPVDFDKLL